MRRSDALHASRLAVLGCVVCVCCSADPIAEGGPRPSESPARSVSPIPPGMGDAGVRTEPPAVRMGRLCVAPLDVSDTPGKGAASVLQDFHHDGAGPPSRKVSRDERVIVRVNGREQTITHSEGAAFDGLALDEPIDVSLRSPRSAPYFSKKLSFRKEKAEILCLYDNAFYGTVQISDEPRRSFCRSCMKR